MVDLAAVREAAVQLADARARTGWAQRRHDQAILAALRDGATGTEVAEAAGISPQRVYKLRDEHNTRVLRSSDVAQAVGRVSDGTSDSTPYDWES